MPALPRESDLKAVVGLLATRLLTWPVAFGVSWLLARLLGPHDRGILAFLNLFGTFAIPLTTFGFGSGTIYMVSTGRYKPSEVAFSCIAFGMIQGTVVATGVFALYRFGMLGSIAREIPPGDLIPFLVVMPLQGATLLLCDLCYGTSQYRIRNAVAIAVPALTGLFTLMAVPGLRLGLHGAVIAAICAIVGAGVFAQLSAWRLFTPAMKLHMGFVQESMRYGIKAWVGDISLLLNLRTDQVILGMIASPSTLGLYSIAVTMSETLWLLPDSIGPVFFNKTASNKAGVQRRDTFERIHRVAVAAGALGAASLALGGPWLLLILFGSRFRGSGQFLLLLLPGALAMISAKIITRYLAACGFAGKASRIQLVGLVGGFLAYTILIPRYDGIGAAIASSLGYLATAIAGLRICRPHGSGGLGALCAFRSSDLQWIRRQFTRKSAGI